MGRELRPVARGWKHPRHRGTYSDGSPKYVPLFSRRDMREDLKAGWDVDPAEYMPEIPEGRRYEYALYETTTPGTPLSPSFRTLEELAAWCEDGATAVADARWTRRQWLDWFRGAVRRG
jgi:hypothetical protein